MWPVLSLLIWLSLQNRVAVNTTKTSGLDRSTPLDMSTLPESFDLHIKLINIVLLTNLPRWKKLYDASFKSPYRDCICS
jgi:hypothetical protein